MNNIDANNTTDHNPPREPLSRQAQKIYETVVGAGGFLQLHTITFSRGIGITSTGQNEFLALLDECIRKNYIRVMFTDNPKKKNGFFTYEYFYQELVPRWLEQNPQACQFHIEHIGCRSRATQSETEPR